MGILGCSGWLSFLPLAVYKAMKNTRPQEAPSAHSTAAVTYLPLPFSCHTGTCHAHTHSHMVSHLLPSRCSQCPFFPKNTHSWHSRTHSPCCQVTQLRDHTGQEQSLSGSTSLDLSPAPHPEHLPDVLSCGRRKHNAQATWSTHRHHFSSIPIHCSGV